jgi:hypothetical protein
VVITTAWAVAFPLTAIVLTALDVANAGTMATILAQVAGFAVPDLHRPLPGAGPLRAGFVT